MKNIIEINNLKYYYKTYKKDSGFFGSLKDFFNRKYEYTKALDIDKIEIKEGDIIGLLGPNGAGKTTLIKILTGVIKENEGEVKVNNFIPYEKKKEYLKQIGVVFGQKSQLIWDLPSIETLLLLKEIYEIDSDTFEKRKENLTNLLNLKDKLNVPVRKLSLGERLKFELICSLIHNPKILFLDEPTIGVDIVSQKAIHTFLKKINKENNTTIILTSHYMKDIESLCSKLIVIMNGQKNLESNLEDLLEKYKEEKKFILKTLTNEIPKILKNIKIADNEYEIVFDNVLEIENNTKSLEEIIFEIFKGD